MISLIIFKFNMIKLSWLSNETIKFLYFVRHALWRKFSFVGMHVKVELSLLGVWNFVYVDIGHESGHVVQNRVCYNTPIIAMPHLGVHYTQNTII